MMLFEKKNMSLTPPFNAFSFFLTILVTLPICPPCFDLYIQPFTFKPCLVPYLFPFSLILSSTFYLFQYSILSPIWFRKHFHWKTRRHSFFGLKNSWKQHFSSSALSSSMLSTKDQKLTKDMPYRGTILTRSKTCNSEESSQMRSSHELLLRETVDLLPQLATSVFNPRLPHI